MKTTVETYTRDEFDFINVNPNEICITDIVEGMESVQRFNSINRTGGKYRFSVLRHSLLVEHILESWGCPAWIRFQGLMHDATEAYLNDMWHNVKNLCPDYRKIEDNIWCLIARKYFVRPKFDPMVKEADNLSWKVEKQLNQQNPVLSEIKTTFFDSDSCFKDFFYKKFNKLFLENLKDE